MLMMLSKKIRKYCCTYLMPVVASILVYLNSLHGDFVHDDICAITTNPDVLGKTPLKDVFDNDFWGNSLQDSRSHKSYRPIATLTFRFNFLVLGDEPVGFHVMNVGLHAVITFLFTRLCSQQYFTNASTVMGIGLLFALHPVHTETVSGLVGRADLLSTLFCLLCIIIYNRYIGQKNSSNFRQKRFLEISLIFSTTCAVLSKEIGMTIFLVLFLLSVTKPREGSNNRFLTLVYVYFYNYVLMIYPNCLTYDWQMGAIPLIHSVRDWRNLLTLFIVVILLALIICALRVAEEKRRQRLILGLSLLLLPMFPASNLFFPVGFVIAERLLYLPSLGYCLLIGEGYESFRKKFPYRTLPFVIFVLTAYCAKTISRNNDWQTRGNLYTSGLKTLPQNAKIHYNYANLQKDMGNIELSVHHLKLALRLWPNYASAHNNLATLLKDADESFYHFNEALRIHPDHANAHFNLAMLNLKRGNVSVALDHMNRFLELVPKHGRLLSKITFKSQQQVFTSVSIAHAANVFMNLKVS